MEAILDSFLLVLVSEMGDKTQLLALVLTAKFKKPWAVMFGIFFATVLNHGLASLFGDWISSLIPSSTMSWVLALTFFLFGLWILIPDKDEELKTSTKLGAFLTTTVAFFFAEMGDKTQLATVALGAKFSTPIAVTIGTTAGMLAADGLAVFLGDKLVQKISINWIRKIASLSFILFGLAILIGW